MRRIRWLSIRRSLWSGKSWLTVEMKIIDLRATTVTVPIPNERWADPRDARIPEISN
jgi:hypothetical protein